MKDEDKTKEQLIKELNKMRQRIAELEALEAECRQSKEALSQNEKSFRTLIEKSVEAAYLVNFDTEIVFWNRAAEEMMALTTVPPKKITLADVLTPDSLKIAMENIAHATQTGTTRPQPYELTVRKFDGTLANVEVFIGLVEYDGKTHMLGTARDITERKRVEESLRESERKLSEQNILLQEKNIALREILRQIEEERKEIQDKVLSNVEKLLLPILGKIKNRGSQIEEAYINLLEDNLKNITSSFVNKIERATYKLTPREIEICNMVQSGLTSKEIASLLNLSYRTIEAHRNNIRKKLGISNKKINMATALRSF